MLLRETVTSPGGTTIGAIRTMEDHGVRAAMLSAIEARDRSRELAGEPTDWVYGTRHTECYFMRACCPFGRRARKGH